MSLVQPSAISGPPFDVGFYGKLPAKGAGVFTAAVKSPSLTVCDGGGEDPAPTVTVVDDGGTTVTVDDGIVSEV